jgi:nucleotide-binding universal stress UspA family protein
MRQNEMIRWSKPETILVATNLFEENTLVIRAIEQARQSRAKVLLVHVIPGPGSMTETSFEIVFRQPESVVRVPKTRLDEIAKEFERNGIECEPIVLTGIPKVEIARLVKARFVDRVTVADRIASGVARLIAGSVAEELIAAIEVPVCVIGRRVISNRICGTPFGRVLLATSFHRDSSLLVNFANTFAEFNHSHLTLLHVLDNAGLSSREWKLARDTARERLYALVPNEVMRRHQPLLLIREGDPATAILSEARSMSEDLVILGSPLPSIVSQLLCASAAHRVIAESPCPVMTVRLHSANSLEQIPELIGAETVPTHS